MFHLYHEVPGHAAYVLKYQTICGSVWKHDSVWYKDYPRYVTSYQYEDSDFCLDCVDLYPIIMLNE